MANNKTVDVENNDPDRKELQELRRDGINLVNYYFVFQGVIFTAFYSSSTSLKCHYRWLPLVLSIIAGTLNLSILTLIAIKFIKLLSSGEVKLLDSLVPTSSHNPKPVPWVTVTYERIWHYFYFSLCWVLFAAFFAVTIYGSYKVPCLGVEPHNDSNNSENCVSICDGYNANNCMRICHTK
ncbi:hypothetical protein LIER_07480 [Lithospermum erythrorhizon]|uniref:Uncharacterized protein n=1 Tax=Lithospermum erythrorhizon TaxID=34254 RepID=A0AAV3PA21_LITER